ncbi:MaoC family dehydratase [Nocardioides sp. WS12]|uniref:MaoC family dehydratase n=1 Tax=Nocardioides sp. WS12 TaxID=2486272 RepID=UPI0015FE5288|nr:MaoC family dehydratase [Nocardioides sp. WS12]
MSADAQQDTDFDPTFHHYNFRRTSGQPRFFEDMILGEKFYMPSRTVTDAAFAAFQVISGDNHPSHYDMEFSRSKGWPDLQAHGLQMVALTAPGASDFVFVTGGAMMGFIEQSSKFLKPLYRGDTVYPAIKIAELVPQRNTGVMILESTVHNQRGELLMLGEQRFLVKRRTPAE